jgi:hypothetical protein
LEKHREDEGGTRTERLSEGEGQKVKPREGEEQREGEGRRVIEKHREGAGSSTRLTPWQGLGRRLGLVGSDREADTACSCADRSAQSRRLPSQAKSLNWPRPELHISGRWREEREKDTERG